MVKHPVRDRIVILFCALCALLGAVAAVALCLGKVSFDASFIALLQRANQLDIKARAVYIAVAVVCIVFFLLLMSVVLPGKRRRSSNFAIQKNENGAVRISLKALDALVQKCLNQHAELKVVTSSLFSDEESILVDVHITLQSDISMPLAISALQKQIKKYLEACSGVMVKEVRVFVDNTMPATEDTSKSPYAIPASLLGIEATEALPSPAAGEAAAQVVAQTAVSEEAADEPEKTQPAAQEESVADTEPENDVQPEDEKTDDAETGDWA